MAETQNVNMSETLDKQQDKSIMKNGSESINDSGIEMSEEKEKVEINQTLNCPWILGQLAWARGSSYPFWPCVVTLDPKTMLYYKIQNKGRSQALMVHVQYFGDGGRHNWVLSHYMMPFSGLEDFHNRAKSVTPEAKKKDPKYATAFCPKLGVKKHWGIGVTEAAGLMHLSNEERSSIFEPVILPPEQTAQPTNSKLKRKLSTRGSKIPSDAPTPGLKRLKKIENEDQAGKLIASSEATSVTVSKLEIESLSSESTSAPEEELSTNTTIASRRKSTRNQNKSLKETADMPKRQYLRKKTPKLSEEESSRRDEIDFEDYYNLNKDFWKADHPDATDEEVKKLLREMWNEMDAKEKSNNLNRNFDDYKYNITADQPEVKRLKQTTSQQEKENSKNTENAQQENNKNISKVNGKNDYDSVKNNPEIEKGIELPKTNGSPQKETSKEVLKVNGSPQKEKSKVVSETKDDSQNVKSEENPKTEVASQNGKSEDSEMKPQVDVEKVTLGQNGPSKEVDEEKICKSCLKAVKYAPEVSKNTAETDVKVTEVGKENNDCKMEVEEAEASDKDKFLCTNCQKEKA